MSTARAKRSPANRLSYLQSKAAKAGANQDRARRYDLAARRPSPERDPALSQVTITTRLVRQAASVIDHDPELVAWVQDKIAATHKRPGRPREVTVRTGLICFIVQVLHEKHFHLFNLPVLLGAMPWRVRRSLGIDYLRSGAPTQVSYSQLLDLFHSMARAFDAWDDHLDGVADEDAIRVQRASDLAEFVRRIITASNAKAPLWKGHGALDATMKWSWERPPGSLNKKVERRGADGDAGPPVRLEEILGHGGDPDPSLFGPSDLAGQVQQSRAGRTKRKKSWPSTWSLGSAWAGRANKTKSVHGIALHTMVRADAEGPTLIEALVVTPANGAPAQSVMPVLAEIHQRRAADAVVLAAVARGEAQLLGDVVADPAYSASTTSWQLPLRRLGASPIFRLHRTNQEGLRWHQVGVGARRAQMPFMNGRPMCDCVEHSGLDQLRFPKFPYTVKDYDVYAADVVRLRDYEWQSNGGPRADGRRSFVSPHGRTHSDGRLGGCEHCVTRAGQPVVAADGRPRQRCCTVRSRLLNAEQLALWQDERFGEADWYRRWNVRNRVEGSYGVLKNRAVISYGHDYHHFVGLARETLVAAFVAVAHNWKMLRSWQAKQAVAITAGDDDFDPFGPLPSTTPTNVPKGRFEAPAQRGPKGLEWLGTSRAGPPPAG